MRGPDRSRSPMPRHQHEQEGGIDSDDLFVWYQDDDIDSECTSQQVSDRFVHYVNNLAVVEMDVNLSARDVHKRGTTWVVNNKAKKGIEVVYRKLNPEDQKLFDVAMSKELDSFLSSEAIAICSSRGVPADRVMQMRWVLTWKSNDENTQDGKKAKARLIIKGFQDPRLIHLPRESPTLSAMGRNLLLSCAARRRMPVSSGDIRTAFLQGDNTESQEELYGEPPPEVREKLGMKDHEILRIIKAVYGLLNAPKRWYESISRFLLDDGWVQHSLDQCLFKRVDQHGVCGYLGIHVDDILCAGAGPEFESSIQRLRERYPFGAWSCAMEKPLVYCGCEISQDANFGIHVKQERFALSIDEIPLGQERKEELFEEITHSERRNMRQALGVTRSSKLESYAIGTLAFGYSVNPPRNSGDSDCE